MITKSHPLQYTDNPYKIPMTDYNWRFPENCDNETTDYLIKFHIEIDTQPGAARISLLQKIETRFHMYVNSIKGFVHAKHARQTKTTIANNRSFVVRARKIPPLCLTQTNCKNIRPPDVFNFKRHSLQV